MLLKFNNILLTTVSIFILTSISCQKEPEAITKLENQFSFTIDEVDYYYDDLEVYVSEEDNIAHVTVADNDLLFVFAIALDKGIGIFPMDLFEGNGFIAKIPPQVFLTVQDPVMTQNITRLDTTTRQLEAFFYGTAINKTVDQSIHISNGELKVNY